MRSQKLDTVQENGKMRFSFGKLFEIVLNLPIQSSSHNVTLVLLTFSAMLRVWPHVWLVDVMYLYVLVPVALRALKACTMPVTFTFFLRGSCISPRGWV